MASWFGWGGEPQYRSPRREPSEVVTDTLMLELSWQLKEAERMQRERDSEYRRLKTGVDYSWLVSTPRCNVDITAGERIGLEELCAKVPPAHCGNVILRFREVLEENEPEVSEVSGLFRSVLTECLERVREDEETQRLSQQWSSRQRAVSMSLLSFRSRVRINPFGSTTRLTGGTAAANGVPGEAYEPEPGGPVKTVSEDVERGMGGTVPGGMRAGGGSAGRAPRVWSMPDFRHQGINGHVG
ncbi:protein RD3 [Engraulis encrasicolus]|uniref:protein RD3 n=1 Tax=Engraulis encrasicolus TaxID=184585 RepID=UPI002FD6B9D5